MTGVKAEWIREPLALKNWPIFKTRPFEWHAYGSLWHGICVRRMGDRVVIHGEAANELEAIALMWEVTQRMRKDRSGEHYHDA